MGHIKDKKARKILRKQLELLAQVSEQEMSPSSPLTTTKAMMRIVIHK